MTSLSDMTDAADNPRIIAALTLLLSSMQIWSWDKLSLDEGTLGRFSVETRVTNSGAVSFLIIDGTEPSDYTMPYNCTAINQYGEDSMIISLRQQGESSLDTKSVG